MGALPARLRDLWAGRLPLVDAFWTCQVFWGGLINIGATLAGLALLAGGPSAGLDEGLTAIAAAGLHLAPMPYNVIVLVGVWRSAGRPAIPALASLVARAASLGLFALFAVL
jgi:hypothetical protein